MARIQQHAFEWTERPQQGPIDSFATVSAEVDAAVEPAELPERSELERRELEQPAWEPWRLEQPKPLARTPLDAPASSGIVHASAAAAWVSLAEIVGRQLELPDFSDNRPPTYPLLAVQRGWHGTVLVRLLIDATGRVRDVELVESSGHDVLDAAAIQALKSWRARPARWRDRDVSYAVQVPVRFHLPSAE